MKYTEIGSWYQLTENCVVPLQFCPPNNITSEFIEFLTSGVLTMRSGYAWDGASGPTVDTDNSMVGACVHDALYQLTREGLLSQEYRKQADEELRRICIEKGMSEIRADMWYAGVRSCGEDSASPENRRKIYEVP